MKLGKLIGILDELFGDYGDVEVSLAIQQDYPLVSSISGVAVDNRRDDEEDLEEEKKPAQIYILEGSNERYGKRDWWDRRIRR